MKSREEKRLRKLSMSQDKIDELHEYDYRLLLDDRNYKEREEISDEAFF